MKKIIVIDFDETLAQSIKAFIKTKGHFDKKDYSNLSTTQWNFQDIFPSITDEEVESIFASKEFYENLELYDGAIKFLEVAKDLGFKLVLCTKGNLLSIHHKSNFIRNKLPEFDEYVFCGLETDKSILQHYGNCLYLDDNAKWLASSSEKGEGILCDFYTEEKCSWKQGWSGPRVTNFTNLSITLISLMPIFK